MNNRNHGMIKWIAFLLALTLFPWAVLAETAAAVEPAAHTVEQRVLPFYFTLDDEDVLESEIELYFVDGGDIPYVALSDYMKSFAGLMNKYDEWEADFHIYRSLTDEGIEAYYVHRVDNHALMVVVPELGVISFDSYNLYTQPTGVTSLVSVMELPDAEDIDLFDLFDEWNAAKMEAGKTGDASSETPAQAPEDGGTPSEAPAQDEENGDMSSKAAAQDAEDGDAPSEAPAQAPENGEESPESDDPFAMTEEEINAAAAEWQAFLESLPDPAQKHSLIVNAGKAFNRYGSGTQLDLSRYGIRLYSIGEECYLPLQTMSDLFMNTNYIAFIYTGESVVGAPVSCELLEKIYEAEPQPMSEAFAEFNYNELMFLLDHFYGLKPEHQIDSFGDMIAHNLALAKDLRSTDSESFDNGVAALAGIQLDDLHSGYSARSWRTPEDDTAEFIRSWHNMGDSMSESVGEMWAYSMKADEFYPEGIPGYEEIGDTAFVTFHEFSIEVDELEDYYELGIPASLEDCRDTIQLILYAHSRITREDSPIRNVVMDLSQNGGGVVPAAIVAICWYLREASMAVRDTMTNALTIMKFKTDMNLNEMTLDDDNDTLAGRGIHRYCLISPVSFSCGNLVPAAFKQSHAVTLIGQRSGGGSCCVLPCTSASGTRFQISGTKQLSITRNGSFYHIDDGIEPDIILTKIESFYDRPALVEIIHEAK